MTGHIIDRTQVRSEDSYLGSVYQRFLEAISVMNRDHHRKCRAAAEAKIERCDIKRRSSSCPDCEV
jgi:hypothetical protein